MCFSVLHVQIIMASNDDGKSENEFEEDIESLMKILNLHERFVCVKEVQCSAGSSSGDNYMSVVKRIIVIGINRNKESVLPLIVKRQIPSLSRRQLYRCDEAFNNEINAYVHIVPTFKRIVGDSLFPKCYFAGTDVNGELIILEDLKHSGYQMGNRFSGLDFEHCTLVMEELAKLHAASIYIQHNDNHLFNEKLENIKEIVYCTEAEDFYREVLATSIREALSSLKSSSKDDDSLLEPIRLIENLQTKLFDIIKNCMLSSTASLSSSTSSSSALLPKVICHGDLWINNLMFKCNESGWPCEVKFIDLQAMRYALPVFDILHFVYTSTKRNFRDIHLNQLLDIYSSSLYRNLCTSFNTPSNSCSSNDVLGSLIEIYSKQNVKKLFYSNILYGLAICMWVTPAVTFDPNNIPNLDKITELKTLNEELDMAQKLTPEYHSRMKDIALEFYQNGYLKCDDEFL